MPWAWRLLVTLPVLLVTAAAVLHLAYPDCNEAEAAPCPAGVVEWRDGAVFLAFVAGMVLLFAYALRTTAARSRPRLAPAVVVAVALAWAYAAGWTADAILNDDGCSYYSVGDETDPQPEWESEFWPARTNCRVPQPGGGSTLVRGDASVFHGVFGFWLAVAALAMIPGRPWLRLLLGVAAFAGSIYAIFII